MSKPKFFRSYEIERDENGMPTKMYWTGDYLIPDTDEHRKRSDSEKLEEWEKLYGKPTSAEVNESAASHSATSSSTSTNEPD